MSGSSQDASLSSGSSKDEEDCMWESAPPSPPPQPANDLISRMGNLDCWDYTLELDCLRGPEGYCFFFSFTLIEFKKRHFIEHMCVLIMWVVSDIDKCV